MGFHEENFGYHVSALLLHIDTYSCFDGQAGLQLTVYASSHRTSMIYGTLHTSLHVSYRMQTPAAVCRSHDLPSVCDRNGKPHKSEGPSASRWVSRERIEEIRPTQSTVERLHFGRACMVSRPPVGIMSLASFVCKIIDLKPRPWSGRGRLDCIVRSHVFVLQEWSLAPCRD